MRLPLIRKIKKILPALFFLFGFLLSGCIGPNPDYKPASSQPTSIEAGVNWDNVVMAHEKSIQNYTTLSVAFGIGMIKDVNHRTVVGHQAYSIAQTLLAAADKERVTVDDLRVLAATQISKVQFDYRLEVITLLNIGLDEVQERLDDYLSQASEDTRSLAIRRFIKAAANGVIAGTGRYAPVG